MNKIAQQLRKNSSLAPGVIAQEFSAEEIKLALVSILSDANELKELKSDTKYLINYLNLFNFLLAYERYAKKKVKPLITTDTINKLTSLLNELQ